MAHSALKTGGNEFLVLYYFC